MGSKLVDFNGLHEDLQEFPEGDRESFLKKCDAGDFDGVVALYRSNDSTKVRKRERGRQRAAWFQSLDLTAEAVESMERLTRDI